MVRLPDRKMISIPLPLRSPEECPAGGKHDWRKRQGNPGSSYLEQLMGARFVALQCSECGHAKWQVRKAR